MPYSIRDVRSALTHFLGNRATELGYDDPKVLTGFSGLPQERPVWVIQSVPGGLSEYPTSHQSLMSYRFNVHFLTEGGSKGYSEAERWVGHIQTKLMNNNWKITGRIIDFEYPKPSAIYRAGEGFLPAGEYYVSVAGINRIDASEVTLPSVPVHVHVPNANGRIRLIVPRYPMGYNWFPTFNVYQGSSPTTMHQMSNSPVTASSHAPKVFDIDNNDININDLPPVSPSNIKFRFIDVMRTSFNVAIQPDVSKEAGTWMGSIFCVLRAPITTVTSEQAGPILVINQDYDVEE